MERLAAQAKASRDAEAREQLEAAGAARQQQLAALQALSDARDRVHAQLERVLATYESLPARAVHLRTLDAQAADSLSGDVSQELDRMNHEIAAFEDSLKELSMRVPA
jgi:hypothetical protein